MRGEAGGQPVGAFCHEEGDVLHARNLERSAAEERELERPLDDDRRAEDGEHEGEEMGRPGSVDGPQIAVQDLDRIALVGQPGRLLGVAALRTSPRRLAVDLSGAFGGGVPAEASRPLQASLDEHGAQARITQDP